eukprot:scaffold1958_cov253-Pinguiococcus_pyrenoidosus.AAC.8
MSFGDGSFGNDTFSPKGGLVTAFVAFGTALGCSFLVEQSVGALVGVWTAALVAVLSLWFYLQPDDVLWWLQTDHVVYRQPDYWWRREQGDEADAELPMLALTIDDVPCGPTCCSCRGRRISDFPESLAILKKHGARATLFVMSDEIDNHPRPDAIREALKEAVDYGCELGNHSTVDEKTILLSEAKLRKSLDKCDAALRAIAPMKVTWPHVSAACVCERGRMSSADTTIFRPRLRRRKATEWRWATYIRTTAAAARRGTTFPISKRVPGKAGSSSSMTGQGC